MDWNSRESRASIGGYVDGEETRDVNRRCAYPWCAGNENSVIGSIMQR